MGHHSFDYYNVKITKADSYTLPNMEDCVKLVGPANFARKFDLVKGYWQVTLISQACKIYAIAISFCLQITPVTFQRFINLVVAGLEGCTIYLDDVVT